ncbi:hypothetical protein GH754_10565 [Salinibacillus xinjiangensis]|uniref:Tubby C-terminal domain-containing protein n=1 Tax=Salinibacillus xinjiangensis TaxID=1229268 RepID=A0A6G1X738_9BACI|nr:hypothetical protein [Salinibacillus xinjiangensis]
MAYGVGYVPEWFLWIACIIFILFIGITYWLTRGKVETTAKGNGEIGNKAFYTENPILAMTKRVEIFDMKTNYVGYVKRGFDNPFQMLTTMFLPNYFVDLYGEDANGNLKIKIHKLREKKDLLQNRWEVQIISKNCEENFMIKGDKKLLSSKVLSFPYKNEIINVSKNVSERTINFHKNGQQISYISSNGKLPPRDIFMDTQDGELPFLLLACIYEVIKFYRT